MSEMGANIMTLLNEKLVKRIGKICRIKDWDKSWIKGGCYLHLEASEFIESLRGKGDDPPEKEAADVLFTLGALIAEHNLDCDKIELELRKQLYV